MNVSVIVVNWNTSKITSECLQSVHEQTETKKIEVIVVDNASTDDSVKVVKEKFPQVILIENDENRGFAAANNQGIKVAKGRYLLLLNSDTLVLDKAIDKAISFADAHPEAAVVGCQTLSPDRTVQSSCFMFPSILNLTLWAIYLSKFFPKSRFFGRERMTWWNRSDVKEVDVVAGCFMLVRRQAIEQVGVMDERFYMYGEETDWCFRFKQAGWKVLFTPSAEIIHLGGASTKQVSSEMFLQYAKSILLFFKKHTSGLSYRLACALLALCFSLRAPYWLAKAIFSKNAKSINVKKAKNYTLGAFRAILGIRT